MGEPMSRRAVVSYAVNASVAEKTNALMDGIRECASELVEFDVPKSRIVDERVEDGAMAAWEHKTAHIVPLCPWDLLEETERAEQVERFRAGLEAVELPIWPDAERKAIAHADLYTTGGLLRALQNAIEEANAFESTPYNLRVLAARALIVARRREMQDPIPSHSPSPSMVRKDL